VDVIERAQGGKIAFELEGEFDGGDLFGIAVGEIGDIAFADVRAVALGLAEIDGLVGFAVGGRPGSAGHVHVQINIRTTCQIQGEISPLACLHIKGQNPAIVLI
jgi:hypothetical protein